MQWVPGREADYCPPSSAEVKNAWRYASSPNTTSRRGAYLSTGTNLPFFLFYLYVEGNRGPIV